MISIISRSIVASVFTSLISSFLASILFMNESYGFGFYFIAFLIYSTPPIFIIGLPLSLLFELLLTRYKIKSKPLYLTTIIILYAGGGFSGTLLYFYALSTGKAFNYKEVFPFTIFGLLVALLFLVNISIINLVQKKKMSENN